MTTWRRARALSWVAVFIIAGCSGEKTLPLEPEDAGDPGDGNLAACVAGGSVGMPRANCPSDLPPDTDCATASPIYDDVAPIFAARCTICHYPGGYEIKYRFDSYAQITSNMTNTRVLTQVYSCRMPPSCAPNLSSDERHTLLQWLVCGAPEGRDGGSTD
jgi:hypothetical protein